MFDKRGPDAHYLKVRSRSDACHGGRVRSAIVWRYRQGIICERLKSSVGIQDLTGRYFTKDCFSKIKNK